MATKKQNKRGEVRRERRALNRVLDDVKSVRRGHLRHNWGSGPDHNHYRIDPRLNSDDAGDRYEAHLAKAQAEYEEELLVDACLDCL